MANSIRLFLGFIFMISLSCSSHRIDSNSDSEILDELASAVFVPGEMDGLTVEECAKVIVQILNEESENGLWSYSIEPDLVYNNISEQLFKSRKLRASINKEISIIDFLTFMQQSVYSGYLLRGREIVFYGIR
ncbi:hypothetical protein [Puniceicoccus vermicola]|uniref:Lipoprotein n=1 Tax=Puniceicoccus vermicola TaxID=388746 RepID=A0A7X1B1I4_9BACT|nr:hypothetical protein [Puniceicoccus vermicola]MBC2603911.1 hypothetical protein [Puniceicoccus vermicola]